MKILVIVISTILIVLVIIILCNKFDRQKSFFLALEKGDKKKLITYFLKVLTLM